MRTARRERASRAAREREGRVQKCKSAVKTQSRSVTPTKVITAHPTIQSVLFVHADDLRRVSPKTAVAFFFVWLPVRTRQPHSHRRRHSTSFMGCAASAEQANYQRQWTHARHSLAAHCRLAQGGADSEQNSRKQRFGPTMQCTNFAMISLFNLCLLPSHSNSHRCCCLLFCSHPL